MKMAKLIPDRPIDIHKGQCGRIGVLAGSRQMMGAAILTARASLRSGSGLVYLMTLEEFSPWINTAYPELIVLPLKTRGAFLTEASFSNITRYIERYRFDCLAVGPGLGREKSTQKMARKVIGYCAQKELPAVIDADGLMALSVNFFKPFSKKVQFVLTPHSKEFDSLFQSVPIHNDKNNTYFCRRSLEVNSSSLTLRAFRKRNVSTTTNVVVDTLSPLVYSSLQYYEIFLHPFEIENDSLDLKIATDSLFVSITGDHHFFSIMSLPFLQKLIF